MGDIYTSHTMSPQNVTYPVTEFQAVKGVVLKENRNKLEQFKLFSLFISSTPFNDNFYLEYRIVIDK